MWNRSQVEAAGENVVVDDFSENESAVLGVQMRKEPHYDGVELNISSLWRGLTPALLLTCNPAIHYTFYDRYRITQNVVRIKPGVY
jgi:hypothetical protein